MADLEDSISTIIVKYWHQKDLHEYMSVESKHAIALFELSLFLNWNTFCGQKELLLSIYAQDFGQRKNAF